MADYLISTLKGAAIGGVGIATALALDPALRQMPLEDVVATLTAAEVVTTGLYVVMDVVSARMAAYVHSRTVKPHQPVG